MIHRLNLLLILTALFAPHGLAQTSPGVRAGLTATTLVGDEGVETHGSLGSTAGVYVRHRLTPMLALQAEIMFGARGADVAVGDETTTIRPVYATLPVLLVVSGPRLVNIEPAVYAGPAAGLPLSGTEGATVSTDLGLVIGAEVAAPLRGRRQQFGIGVRYTLGLTSGVTVDGRDLRHAGLAVIAHFQF